MNTLVQQRCQYHAGREAAARCPECKLFFCRECVSEHDDRILCAACLRQLVAPLPSPRRSFRGILSLAQCMLAVALVWFFFFLIGKGLLAIPSAFHEGTFWEKHASP